MDRKAVIRLSLSMILILVLTFAILWAVMVLPGKLPAPKATIGSTPFTETVNHNEKLSMTAVAGTAHSTGVTLEIQNNTGMELSSGHAYGISVQILQNGQWYPMQRRTDKRAVTMVPSIHIVYPAEKTRFTQEISWEPFIGRLEPGHYRVVWSFSVHEGSDSAPVSSVRLAAEFDVTQ